LSNVPAALDETVNNLKKEAGKFVLATDESEGGRIAFSG
jgi:hypothetical protein